MFSVKCVDSTLNRRRFNVESTKIQRRIDVNDVENTSHQRRKDVTSSIFESNMRRMYYVEILFSRYEDAFIQRLRRGRFQRLGDVNFDLKLTSNRRLQLTFFRRLFDVSVLVGLVGRFRTGKWRPDILPFIDIVLFIIWQRFFPR